MPRRLRLSTVATMLIAWVAGAAGGTVASAATNSSAEWTQISTGSAPAVRQLGAMAQDPAGGTLLFGGANGVAFLGDTWNLSNGTWTQRSTGIAPTARSRAAFAYDPLHNTAVLFGGWSAAGYLGDTWLWDGASWKRITTTTSPRARSDAAMAYSADLGGLVLHGGAPNGSEILSDTWLWDGTTWRQLAAGAAPALAEHGMAPEPATGGVIMFGGSTVTAESGYATSGATWVLDGDIWTKRQPSRSPAPRAYVQLALDSSAGLVVLATGDVAGGAESGDNTWTWNGTTWTEQNPVHQPGNRTGAQVAYDTSTSHVVLFGGARANFLNDTWSFTPNRPEESSAPIVGPSVINRVYLTEAQLTVNVNGNGLASKVWVAYGPDADHMTEVFVDDLRADLFTTTTGYDPVSFDVGLGSLTPGTRYQLQVRAVSGGGTVEGGQLQFTTLPEDYTAPTITIKLPSRATRATATAWTTLRGTAADSPSGVAYVKARMIQKRGDGWSAFRDGRWVAYGTKVKANSRAGLVRVVTDSRGRWAAAFPGVRRGKLVASARAVDHNGNASWFKTVTQTVTTLR